MERQVWQIAGDTTLQQGWRKWVAVVVAVAYFGLAVGMLVTEYTESWLPWFFWIAGVFIAYSAWLFKRSEKELFIALDDRGISGRPQSFTKIDYRWEDIETVRLGLLHFELDFKKGKTKAVELSRMDYAAMSKFKDALVKAAAARNIALEKY